MKERIKGAFTKKKIFHFFKMALFVVALSLILLSLLGTVAHATGLVDDTINAENLYSKYPLSNYQLDFYVDNSWSWLPWNWLDGKLEDMSFDRDSITLKVQGISLTLRIIEREPLKCIKFEGDKSPIRMPPRRSPTATTPAHRTARHTGC